MTWTAVGSLSFQHMFAARFCVRGSCVPCAVVVCGREVVWVGFWSVQIGFGLLQCGCHFMDGFGFSVIVFRGLELWRCGSVVWGLRSVICSLRSVACRL